MQTVREFDSVIHFLNDEFEKVNTSEAPVTMKLNLDRGGLRPRE